jgi:hypothetical protein
MIVAVMRVRVMRVRMRHAIVPVAMRMSRAGRNGLVVGMTVMLVMLVLMLVAVLHSLVGVTVLVPLGEMQPDSARH